MGPEFEVKLFKDLTEEQKKSIKGTGIYIYARTKGLIVFCAMRGNKFLGFVCGMEFKKQLIISIIESRISTRVFKDHRKTVATMLMEQMTKLAKSKNWEITGKGTSTLGKRFENRLRRTASQDESARTKPKRPQRPL